MQPETSAFTPFPRPTYAPSTTSSSLPSRRFQTMSKSSPSRKKSEETKGTDSDVALRTLCKLRNLKKLEMTRVWWCTSHRSDAYSISLGELELDVLFHFVISEESRGGENTSELSDLFGCFSNIDRLVMKDIDAVPQASCQLLRKNPKHEETCQDCHSTKSSLSPSTILSVSELVLGADIPVFVIDFIKHSSIRESLKSLDLGITQHLGSQEILDVVSASLEVLQIRIAHEWPSVERERLLRNGTTSHYDYGDDDVLTLQLRRSSLPFGLPCTEGIEHRCHRR